MDIEYLDKFEELQQKDTFRGQQWLGERKRLVGEYSWAVPNEQVLTYLSQFDTIVEVGAGSGYWAKCIEDAGGNVVAFDKDPWDDTWRGVDEATVEEVGRYIREEPLLLVWPPHDDPMAANAVSFEPSHILYVGETRGGCTANDEFFDYLGKEYGLVAKIDLPSYAGIHDDFYHYARKV